MKLTLLEKIFRWQYPFVMLASLALAFFSGTTNEIIMPLLLLFWFVYGLYAYSKSVNSSFKSLFTFVVVYTLLTIVSYTFNGVPFLAYYSDFRGFVMPMLCVYVGLFNKDEGVNKWFVLATVFCSVVGIYLFFAQPSWYLAFKVNALSNTWFMEDSNLSENNVMALSTTGRMSSFFPASYNLVYYSIYSLCITLNDLFKDRANRLFKSNFVLLVIIGELIVGVLLTMTRVAVVFLFMLLFFYFIYGSITKNKNRHLVRGIIVVIVVAIILAFIRIATSDYGSFILERLGDRLSFEAASELTEGSSRMNQVDAAFSSWNNILFGDGLGSKGGVARSVGLPGVTDNNWVKILIEFGVVGMLLYVIAFFISLKRGYKYRRYYMTEITMVVYGLISMLVASTLTKGDVTIMFWFALGRIWNRQLLQDRTITKNYI